ncbi:MAG TPA: RIO1 family regulatory kinase/ATPase [Planctomycetota bacterium]|nr:RIO1 family regulatory kinase/ATPase [Planctomycetota bacterium]
MTRVLRDKGGFLSPVVSVVTHEGRSAVLKDYRSKNAITRNVVAPLLVRREFDILKHLEGVPGIPRVFKVLEKRALLMEYIEGRTIGKFRPGELPDAVYEKLCSTVRAMHRRGVAHLDLRQKKNIVVSDGRPYVIDFANALRFKGRVPAPLRAVDESGLLKFKRRNFPHLLTEADREKLEAHKFARKFWIFSPRGKSVR